ncbi:H[+]-ATPase 8 [Actinidia rufa]|uniref:H[+]-ATPase 8 n=1 Tax=Actinidia rufa TaxID=165716 RepID=A0A7J0GEW8_9ERIC|nr:H[+]-ATPase 8 [Actinidia rufa]
MHWSSLLHTLLGKAVHLVDNTNKVGHFQKGAITERTTTMEEMAGIDVFFNNKTRILTLKQVDKCLLKVL